MNRGLVYEDGYSCRKPTGKLLLLLLASLLCHTADSKWGLSCRTDASPWPTASRGQSTKPTWSFLPPRPPQSRTLLPPRLALSLYRVFAGADHSNESWCSASPCLPADTGNTGNTAGGKGGHRDGPGSVQGVSEALEPIVRREDLILHRCPILHHRKALVTGWASLCAWGAWETPRHPAGQAVPDSRKPPESP